MLVALERVVAEHTISVTEDVPTLAPGFQPGERLFRPTVLDDDRPSFRRETVTETIERTVPHIRPGAKVDHLGQEYRVMDVRLVTPYQGVLHAEVRLEDWGETSGYASN